MLILLAEQRNGLSLIESPFSEEQKNNFQNQLESHLFLNHKKATESLSKEEPVKKLIKKPNVIRTIKNKKIVYCQTEKPKNGVSTATNEYSNYEASFSNNSNNSKELSDCTACISNTDINIEENEDSSKSLEDRSKRGKRGSKYRGVSKNGNQWQVLIMVNKKKRYIGNYKTEDEAASSYDIVAIQNHGKKAKTNFYYTPEEILKIRQDKKITWRS